MWKFIEEATFKELEKSIKEIEEEFDILSYSFSRGRFCYSVMLEVEPKEES